MIAYQIEFQWQLFRSKLDLDPPGISEVARQELFDQEFNRFCEEIEFSEPIPLPFPKQVV